MKTYTYKASHFESGLQVGEPVEIDGAKIVVITILQVDFDTETVVFCGMNVSEITQ